ncbi:UDP-glucose/GDP-mannose dehydrogenase family protein [Bradyrhizobium manausense]|uniref:nucleotide sugar dehydrogenase n=1 Tax=Bradyrhizobium manausense TaxID=989370 RepID=UPI001BAE3A65|nr:nucleotide sugar dehydrogenase [Bradyrhizobium manausense]MBR1089719.1 UDP-glucose/GDP-mannose dehydrogenase family protein [Bradyrhizobium manausense]
MTRPLVAYAGMTHLGLCSAIAAAAKGFATLGFDADARMVGRIAVGDLPVREPGLDELLRTNRDHINFSADAAALRACDLVYVAPDVPTDGAGVSDLSGIDALLDNVLANTRDDAVIVILSQVPPGFTRARQHPGRIILYQVETLVFGRAVERATKPERFILGCLDPDAQLPAAWRSFLESFGCPLLPMRLESAELAKISINCALAASITTANTLAELCERVGADWSEIAPALKLDARIGPSAYLAPGLGLAGGNIERDLATVMRLSDQHGTDAGMIRAIVANSVHRKDWALRELHEALLARTSHARIGVLGLAYKENTHSVKNSAALALIAQLAPWPMRAFDPAVPVSAAQHPNLTAASSALEAARDVDALAIMTPWPEFRELLPADLARLMRGRLMLDPYRVLDATAARAAGLDYRTLGARAW